MNQIIRIYIHIQITHQSSYNARTRHAVGGHGDVAQEDAGVDGPVVHALLRLLQQRLPVVDVCMYGYVCEYLVGSNGMGRRGDMHTHA